MQPAPEQSDGPGSRLETARLYAKALPALLGRGFIKAYQLTVSGLIGRHCRHLPTCSEYTDEAIGRFGLWRGGWMGAARICRCNPWGTAGLDFVPRQLPAQSCWYKPWRYGRWRGTLATPPVCDRAEPGDGFRSPDRH